MSTFNFGKIMLNLFTGRASKVQQFLYILSVVVFYFCLIIISIIFILGQFAFNRYWISSLGNPHINPQGNIYFNLGCFFTGVLLIPVFRYFYNNLANSFPKTSKINLIIGFIISISLSSIGILHDIYQPIHNILAGFVFVGFFIHAIIMTYIIIKQLVKKADWMKLFGFIVFYGPMYIFIVLVFAIPIVDAHPANKLIIWEWIAFLINFVWLIGTFFLIKNKSYNQK